MPISVTRPRAVIPARQRPMVVETRNLPAMYPTLLACPNDTQAICV